MGVRVLHRSKQFFLLQRVVLSYALTRDCLSLHQWLRLSLQPEHLLVHLQFFSLSHLPGSFDQEAEFYHQAKKSQGKNISYLIIFLFVCLIFFVVNEINKKRFRKTIKCCTACRWIRAASNHGMSTEYGVFHIGDKVVEWMVDLFPKKGQKNKTWCYLLLIHPTMGKFSVQSTQATTGGTIKHYVGLDKKSSLWKVHVQLPNRTL